MLKVLKNVEPEIRTYLGDAFCFSIINDEAFESGWIYDKYIDIEYTRRDRHIKYYGYDYYDFVPDQNVFIKSFTQMPVYLCDEAMVCSVIEDMINDGEYFVGFWNETIVYNYFVGAQLMAEFEHLCFVYGYDSCRKVFYSKGYVKDEKWQKFCLPYDVLVKALLAFTDRKELGFNGYQVVNNYIWKPNDDITINKLKSFFAGANRNIEAECQFFYDIAIYKTIHQQSVYCIYEHKMLMLKRINYLVERNYIDTDSKEIIEKYHKLVNSCKNILLLSIKYQNDNSAVLLEKILAHAKRMLRKEKEIMETLIGNL